MRLSNILSRAALVVALGAFGLTGTLSLRAQVEPLYAVVRSVVAFLGVLWLTRWSADALDSLGPVREEADTPRPGDDGVGKGARGRNPANIRR